MQNLQLTIQISSAKSSAEFVLHADPETPIAKVIEELKTVHPGPFFVDGQALPADVNLAQSGLRSGVVITAGAPDEPPAIRSLQIAIVGGPFAGTVMPVPDRGLTVGRAKEANLRLSDSSLSPLHFKVWHDGLDVCIKPFGSSQIAIGGDVIEEQCFVQHREVFSAGSCLFEVRLPVDSDADIHVDDEGALVFNRASRILPPNAMKQFTVPSEPRKPGRVPIPWVQIIAPLVLSIAMAFILGNPTFLLFALLSPIMAASSTWTSRKERKRNYKEEMAAYTTEYVDVQGQIEETAHWQALGGRYLKPDAVALYDIATLPRKRLWERRFDDDDFLTLRLGTLDRPADIELTGTSGSKRPVPPVLSNDPVAIELPKLGVFGIAGPASDIHGVGRFIAMQIATLHRSNDVQLFVLSNKESIREWDCLRWLPHVAMGQDSGAPFTSLGFDARSNESLIKHLVGVLNIRAEAIRDDVRTGPTIVVIFDDMRSLRNVSGVGRLLKQGPSVQIYAIGLDVESSRLAQESPR